MEVGGNDPWTGRGCRSGLTEGRRRWKRFVEGSVRRGWWCCDLAAAAWGGGGRKAARW